MSQLKASLKVIGYFAYTSSGEVLCDGDACVIGGTEEEMRFYLGKMTKDKDRFIIKKTRFGEIITGIEKGAAYAFDEVSYLRFLPLASKVGVNNLPPNDCFVEFSDTGVHFVRIQFLGS